MRLVIPHPHDVLMAKLERWETGDREHARRILDIFPLDEDALRLLDARMPYRGPRQLRILGPIMFVLTYGCVDGKPIDMIYDDSGVIDSDSSGPSAWYLDADADGFGDPASSVESAEAPPGYVADSSDCDDSNSDVFPGAPEACDDLDNDCDGDADEDLAFSDWYGDADGDGWGTAEDAVEDCEQPVGTVETPGDCDDSDPAINPGAEDICENGLDEDCVDGDPACRLEGTLDLGDADAIYLGTLPGGLAGVDVTCDGDTDADGYPESLIRQSEEFYDVYTEEEAHGGAWLMDSISRGSQSLDEVAVALWGEEKNQFLFGAAEFARDLDGDGYDEIVMGSTRDSSAYLFNGPVESARVPSDADAVISSDYTSIALGYSAVAPGSSLLVVAGRGNVYQDGVWGVRVGEAFVFLGPLSGSVSTGEAIATLTPDVYHSEAQFGEDLCAADLDGDGQLDLAVSAPAAWSYPDYAFLSRGVVYVVYGPLSGDLRMATTDGALVDADARVEGADGVDSLGYSVSCGGDADGDGSNDTLLGAPGLKLSDSSRGAAFLFNGPLSGVVTVEDADTSVTGAAEGDFLGWAVSLDADLDASGRPEVLVSAGANAGRGEVYVFYDSPTGSLDAADADATLQGEAEGDYAMYFTGCPDLDGDGFDDLLIGAPYAYSVEERAGAAYVVFGGGG